MLFRSDGIRYGNLKNLDDRAILGMDGQWLDYFLHHHVIEDGTAFLDRFDDDHPVEKIEYHIPESWVDVKEKVMNYLNATGLMISSSFYTNIEITHPQATKGKAVQWLMEYLQCQREEDVAAGDNANDITMLQQVEHSIAVDNAIEEVKKTARYHADDFDRDGAARMMEEIVFHHKIVK